MTNNAPGTRVGHEGFTSSQRPALSAQLHGNRVCSKNRPAELANWPAELANWAAETDGSVWGDHIYRFQRIYDEFHPCFTSFPRAGFSGETGFHLLLNCAV
jgi:hypothetical protein